MNTTSSSHFTLGAVARSAGIGIDTLRYCERDGLLPPPRRRDSGCRDYAPGDVQRLKFIRRAKGLGFTLEDIRQLPALPADHELGVKRRAQARLDDIDQRIRELQRVRRGLRRLTDACPGRGDPHACPILGALNEDSRDA